MQRPSSCGAALYLKQLSYLRSSASARGASMTCVDAGALGHARGSGHPVALPCDMHVCMQVCLRSERGGPVSTVTTYMAQIPGVSDRMTKRSDKSECICCVFHLVLTTTSLLQFTSHGVNAQEQGN